MSDHSRVAVYSFVVLAVFIWSAVHPYDWFTWVLEVLPAVAGIGLLAAAYGRFRFTGLIYFLVMLHAIVLIVGGHYTYARVPLFNWIRDAAGLMRNDYDRVGHFLQGFVPALITREVLLRLTPLRRGKMVTSLSLCVPQAFSSLYELFEWRVAVATGSAADSFLGTQGDVWDTQEDMATCLVGASVALLLMSRFQDRLIEKIARTGKPAIAPGA